MNQKNESEQLSLEELEKKYGTVKSITVGVKKVMQPDPKNKHQEIEVVVDPGKTFYLRRLDRATIKYALSKQIKADGTIDTVSPGEVVLSKCWVGGDPEVKSDNRYYFQACIEASGYLQEEIGFF